MLRRKVARVTQSQCNGSACEGVTPDGNKAAAVLCSVETEELCNITREELCSDVQVSMQETLQQQGHRPVITLVTRRLPGQGL